MAQTDVNFIVALIAGLISFLSPCVLPLVPGFISYLSGTSVGQEGARAKLFASSAFFVLGFSTVFAALGVLLQTILSSISYDLVTWLARLAGIVIIIFALNILGLLKLSFLEKEHKVRITKRFHNTYANSFIFGAAFAAGWTPCVSAVLAAILALSTTSPGLAFWLLMSYAIGLGLPFLAVGLFMKEAIDIIKRSQAFLKYFNKIVGVLLLILGLLIFTMKLNIVAYFGIQWLMN